MLPGLFDSTNIPILQEVISFAENRHHVLAGNVANVDTPGYRVRDLSVETFQKRLKEVIDAQAGPDETHVAGTRRLRPDGPDAAGAGVDGNHSVFWMTATSVWNSKLRRSPRTNSCTTWPCPS